MTCKKKGVNSKATGDEDECAKKVLRQLLLTVQGQAGGEGKMKEQA